MGLRATETITPGRHLLRIEGEVKEAADSGSIKPGHQLISVNGLSVQHTPLKKVRQGGQSAV